MLGNEHKLSWVSKHVGAKSNRPFLAALLIAVFFVLTRRRPDEGSGVVDTARDVRKVAEMVRRSKDSLVLDSWREYLVSRTSLPPLPYNRAIAHAPTHAPTHAPLFLFVLFLQDSATVSAWKALADEQRSLLFPCSEHSNETYPLANPISSFSSSGALWSMMSSVRVVVVLVVVHLARASHSLSSVRRRKHQSRAIWRPSQ